MFSMNSDIIKHANVYKQIFTDHWEGFKKENPWYDCDYCNDLVSKMLFCGDPVLYNFFV